MYPSALTSAMKDLALAKWPSQWLDWGRNGIAPLQTAGVPWWMFPRRIGNKTKFFSFFSDKPFHGQFSQDDPIIILQRRLPPPNPMGGLSEGKRKRKRKGKGVWGGCGLDNNKIHDKIKWDKKRWRVKQRKHIASITSLMDCVECMCANCLMQYVKKNWSS